MAHKKHLYQLLVNKENFSHIYVSLSYCLLQLIINYIWLIFNWFSSENSNKIFIFNIIILIMLYYAVKNKFFKKKINENIL